MNIIGFVPLASRVLAVCVCGTAGDWAVYIDAVPGKDHQLEKEDVLLVGNKVKKELAFILFPLMDKKKFRR